MTTQWLAAKPASDNPLRWLLLAIGALIAAGFLAIVLVLSRTPAIQEIIPFQDFFKTALVVHVDLSVLIWFLAFASLFWSLATQGHARRSENLSLLLVGIGTLMLVASPFVGEGHPLMNNYVPVLQTPVFLAGLIIIGAGVALQAVRALLVRTETASHTVLASASRLSAATTLLAILAVGLSYRGLSGDMPAQSYYEFLFWGGGHVLQFSHTILLILAWMWLIDHTHRVAPGRYSVPLLILAAAPALGAIPIYMVTDITDAAHRTGFTELMRYGGLAALPAIALIAWQYLSHKADPAATPGCRSALFASWVLFATGGVLGFMIQGVNVVIPAHYHGSIVGVTLVYMGISYLLLQHWGYEIHLRRTARWQPLVYGGGQLLHILGLAWSGGYGVQRKTAGAAQGLDSLEKTIGMGMMGLGGMIAVIGGIMFLVVALHTFKQGKRV